MDIEALARRRKPIPAEVSNVTIAHFRRENATCEAKHGQGWPHTSRRQQGTGWENLDELTVIKYLYQPLDEEGGSEEIHAPRPHKPVCPITRRKKPTGKTASPTPRGLASRQLWSAKGSWWEARGRWHSTLVFG